MNFLLLYLDGCIVIKFYGDKEGCDWGISFEVNFGRAT
jgi:hypothetical protein